MASPEDVRGFLANMTALSEGDPEPLGYGRRHKFPLSTRAGVEVFLIVPNHGSSGMRASKPLASW